eukprot:TRINITY_DN7564_c0_g1_i2.p2 TRINITY_DN7564_c0_g1~~TRINITY_DN7564_c0_g1_i2.p2  ORF type:complete len:477 (-),score=71.96 TRINITY_DN7564_c0_g1_i2:430-1860(-)
MYKRPNLENQQYYSSFQSDNYQNRENGNEHLQSDNFRGLQGSSSGRGRAVRADHLLNFKYDNSGNQRMHRWRRNNNYNRNNGYQNNSNYSHFSKFVPISDATDIYVDTVKRLAEKASQAIKEGGSEVVDEVPYLYTCVDVTAIKARQWTFRRAQLQINPQQIVGSESSKDIADMNQRADAVEAFVREAFMKTDLQGTSNQDTSDPHIHHSHHHHHRHPKKSLHHNLPQQHGANNASNFYYFYQCADGQQIFLLPMNAKCILSQYGSWENCPRRILGEVLEVEENVQGEEERKRWKFLAHLPQSSSFKFCEIKMDLEEFPAASQFDKDIQKRQRAREKLAAKQAKEDARAVPTLAEDAYPTTSYVQIPSMTEWQNMPALSTSDDNNNNKNTSNEGNSPPRPGVSFANITRLGYAVTSSQENLGNKHDTVVEVEENKWTDLLAPNSGKNESDKNSGKKTFKGKVKGKKLSLSSFQRRQ